MQKKLLATLVASAFAGAAGVATAGPISVASIGTYAVEAMGTNVTVTVGNVSYTLTNPFAPGSTQTLRYALDTSVGVVGNCPNVTLTPNVATATISLAVLSTDKLSCSYTVTTTTDPVPANTTVNFTNAKAASSAPLSTSGGKITATVSVLDGGLNVVESNSAAVAQSADAFTASVVSSSALTPAELSRVDVTTTPTPGTAFTNETDATTSTTVVNLGRVRVTETQGDQLFSNGTTKVDFTTATVENLTVEVSGPFLTKAANGNQSTLTLNDAANCAGTILASITGPSSSASNKLGPVDITSVTPVSGNKDVYICYTLPGTNNSPVNTGQFTATATFDPGITVATDLSDEVIGTTNIYNLQLNGVRVDIRNYVPNAFAGWFSAYRIINTGAVPAVVTGQYIGQNGATVGSALPLTGPIPAGGVVVLNSADIEAVLGAASAPGGVGPRLRLTAPTDSIRVQAFACQPSGPCFLNTDAQAADNGGSDK
ncbi:MAG TPA: hypothetical protein VNK91_07765 [Burkholderiaceae bacterium]|nr:hypothetical protein [Burkholderiaceae bacterium]